MILGITYTIALHICITIYNSIDTIYPKNDLYFTYQGDGHFSQITVPQTINTSISLYLFFKNKHCFEFTHKLFHYFTLRMDTEKL